MDSLNIEFALYGSKNNCTKAEYVPIFLIWGQQEGGFAYNVIMEISDQTSHLVLNQNIYIVP